MVGKKEYVSNSFFEYSTTSIGDKILLLCMFIFLVIIVFKMHVAKTNVHNKNIQLNDYPIKPT